MTAEYPKWLHHPGFAPAVLSDDYALGGGRNARFAPDGKPSQFPPVVVHNADQEAMYVARGYAAGAYDHAKVERMRIAPLPNGYREQEYPRFESDGSVTPDPNPPPVDNHEFPKWVGDEIALNAEEEAAILARGSLKNEPTQTEPPVVIIVEDDVEEAETLTKAEIAAFREWMAAGKPNIPRDGPSETASSEASGPALGGHRDRGTPEHRKLVRLCREAGIKADGRWPMKKLRDMLEAATAPQQETDDAHDEEGQHAGEEAAVQESRGVGHGGRQEPEDRGHVSERRSA